MNYLLLLLFSAVFAQQCFTVSIDWDKVIAISKTTTTLQVVANPLLNPRTSPVAKTAWKNLGELGADMVRYVPWFPFPKVGVAELEPPTPKKTFWNFENIVPQFGEFMKATFHHGRDVVPNFSTQPTWMYNTGDWTYPKDPNQVDWNYPRGGPNPNTTQLVAEYYGRLLSWIMKGGFTDENGVFHAGGYHYPLTHWEVFNEPEGCHGLDVQSYTLQYDAIVNQIRKVADQKHNIQFVGLALEGRKLDWIQYFLDEKNHDPKVLPIDWFSFHFYASSSSRTDPKTYSEFFGKADEFFVVARQIMDLKNKMSPHTKIDVDEIGVILPGDNDANPPDPPRIYWSAANAYYSYIYANLAIMGYDVLGCSQLAGSPPIPEWRIPDNQYPSVSMLNWTTGEGNARFHGLKLLIDHFETGDLFAQTNVSSAHPRPSHPNPHNSEAIALLPHVQAIHSHKHKHKKLLVINKNNAEVCVDFGSRINGDTFTIDLSTEDKPARKGQIHDTKLNLAAFAVTVIEIHDK